MNLIKYLEDYDKSSYKLLFQSLFLFLLIPTIYLSFVEIVSSSDNKKFIESFENPNYFNLSIEYVYFFKTLSKSICIITFVNFAILLFVNWYVGINHKRLTNIYLPVYKITWLIIKFLTIANIAIFLFIFVISLNNIFPTFKMRHWSLLAIGAPIIAALSSFEIVISIINRFDKSNSYPVIGCNVSKKEQPELFKLIKECSSKIKTAFPDNIVLGTTEGFFVISSDVYVVNKKRSENLKGKTLYISYLMLKILTKDELRGIIGHELAHFSGEDTEYSEKFKTVKFNLIKKIKSFEKKIDEKKSEYEIAIFGPIYAFFEKFFLITLLNPIIYITINLYKKDYVICMNQELRADKIGAKLCDNKKSMISSLCKFHIYSEINHDISENSDHQKGKSLTEIFSKNYKNYLSTYKFKDILIRIMSYEMSHPSDTHPAISERMYNLNINFREIKESDLTKKIPSASNYIKNFHQFDKILT